MGLLVDGIWHDQWYDNSQSGGRFERSAAQFRNWITSDGSPGTSGRGGFEAQKGRYHLYVSLACPWAHRVLIMRQLKGLDEMINVSVVHWLMGDKGWTFEKDDAATGDLLFDSQYMHQIYTRADPVYSGRVTVPVLWDKELGTIVSNESSEIIRMMNDSFNHLGAKESDYWPIGLRDEIETINTRIYHMVNNGVYRSGFATTQVAYEEAVEELFEALEWLELRLAKRRWLVGDCISEADIRLFTTLVRFDPVYVSHFKCNRKRLIDFPNLWNYTLDIFQLGDIAKTVHFDHIKKHYYGSHQSINPTSIIPVGPDIDYKARHNRDKLSG